MDDHQNDKSLIYQIYLINQKSQNFLDNMHSHPNDIKLKYINSINHIYMEFTDYIYFKINTYLENTFKNLLTGKSDEKIKISNNKDGQNLIKFVTSQKNENVPRALSKSMFAKVKAMAAISRRVKDFPHVWKQSFIEAMIDVTNEILTKMENTINLNNTKSLRIFELLNILDIIKNYILNISSIINFAEIENISEIQKNCINKLDEDINNIIDYMSDMMIWSLLNDPHLFNRFGKCTFNDIYKFLNWILTKISDDGQDSSSSNTAPSSSNVEIEISEYQALILCFNFINKYYNYLNEQFDDMSNEDSQINIRQTENAIYVIYDILSVILSQHSEYVINCHCALIDDITVQHKNISNKIYSLRTIKNSSSSFT